MNEVLKEHVRNIEDNATFLSGQVKGLNIIYEQLLDYGRKDDPDGALSLLEVCIKEIGVLVEGIKENIQCIIKREAA